MTDTWQDVLSFWFREIAPKAWWKADPDFDALVRRRFANMLDRAACCELAAWRRTPRGRLAEVIVLDQFSRNIHRRTPRAFAQDPLALALSQEAIAAGAASAIEPAQRAFLYMPFMHSESALIHTQALRLFAEPGLEDNLRSEVQHKEIIDRFGRYPHRNEVLGRPSTAEEIAFLQQPGSSF